MSGGRANRGPQCEIGRGEEGEPGRVGRVGGGGEEPRRVILCPMAEKGHTPLMRDESGMYR